MDKSAFFNTADMKKEVLDGGVTRYIYTGEQIQLVEYHFPANQTFPRHVHDVHEQMGRLISGRFELEVDGEVRVMEPGDFYHARTGVPHSARTLDEPAVLLDIFSPPRDDLK